MGSSGDEGATMGAASAKGDDTEEGVEDLVACSCCRLARLAGLLAEISALWFARRCDVKKCAGDREDIGVGSTGL